MNRFSALIVSLGLLGGCTPAPSPGPLPAPGTPSAEVVERALASVVLVVNTRDDGSVVYGSGVVLDGRGLVVTNAHLLAGSRSLRAMLYQPGRVSYTPMDGGLARYLFEYERDLVAARVERADDVTDLALLRLDADTSRLPAPRFAPGAPRRGERVFSIGHPQENVWSFTAGQVGALHHGAVQHDALLSFGSSGGALLNERGELVGINTSKVVSEARGLSFARPVAMVEALVSSSPGATPELDLSTPERAAKSCWLARELASPGAAACLDAGAARPAPPDEAPRPAEACAAQIGTPPARQRALHDVLAPGPLPSPAPASVPEATPPASASVPEATPPAPPPADARPKASPPGRGVRVEQVAPLGEGLAWVRLEARSAAGKTAGFSELYARVGGRWLQRAAPSPDERHALPPGWPPPRADASPAPALRCP